MIIETTREYSVNPDEIAVLYHEDYQEFIQFTDNESTEDFVLYLMDKLGVDQIVSDLNLEPEGAIDRTF